MYINKIFCVVIDFMITQDFNIHVHVHNSIITQFLMNTNKDMAL